MGAINSLMKYEKVSWRNHSIEYDNSERQNCLNILENIKNDVEIYMAFTSSRWNDAEFQHWFLSDGTHFIEFGSFQSNIYKAKVTINTNPREFTKCTSNQMNEQIRERICHVLGMCNYSLALRNCEHVANYIFGNGWISDQMNGNLGLLFNIFKDELLGEHKKLVNTFPSSIRPHVFNGCEKRIIYSFLTDHLKATRFDYYLDNAEDTYNILVVGPTGAGKSHLINVFFNQPICNSDFNLKSVTREIYFIRGRGEVYDTQSKQFVTKDVVVANTVGLCDAEWKDGEIVKLIKNRISKSCRYIDAAFIVFRTDRLIKQHIDNIKKILKCLDYCKKNNKRFFFVGTHADFLSQEKKAELSKQFKEIFVSEFVVDKTIKFESLIFVGFPPEDELHPKTKDRVIESYENLTLIRKQPGECKRIKIPLSLYKTS